MRLTLLLLIAVVLIAVCPLTASAQTSTSRVSGRVVDAKQASVAGASVTITNEATGVSQTQTTTDAGVYAFEALPVGNYTLTVEQNGFKKFVKTGNHLEVNNPLTVDVVLEIGQLTEIVTVQGGPEQLQTANATSGNVVEQKAIETLLLNGRNPLALWLLVPGVVQRSFGCAGSGVHVNGSRDRAYNVTIDGIEANQSIVSTPVSNLCCIIVDNAQEFKVMTNNATADQWRTNRAYRFVAARTGASEHLCTGLHLHRI